MDASDATLAETSAALRALADPTRLRMYLFLRQGEACVCEIAGELALAENLISHHLAALRRAGLVCDRRDAGDARWVYYRLNRDTLRRLAGTLGPLFDADTVGERTPSCGPAALIQPGRARRDRLASGERAGKARSV